MIHQFGAQSTGEVTNYLIYPLYDSLLANENRSGSSRNQNVRTSVPLNGISALVNGELEDPGWVLGPHRVTDGDREAVSVRAYFPESKRVWVDSGHGQPRPMRQIHPCGLYETTCPINSETPYQLQVMDAKRYDEPISRPLRLSLTVFRS